MTAAFTIWKPVKGFPGYEVSDRGQVRSYRELKPARRKKDGYVSVSLRRDGTSTTKTVHRLMAEAFIPNPDEKPDVAHGNGVRHQNEIGNLRWATELENASDRVSHGTHGLKLTPEKVAEMRQLHANGGVTQTQLAQKFGVSDSLVSGIVNGKKWRIVS